MLRQSRGTPLCAPQGYTPGDPGLGQTRGTPLCSCRMFRAFGHEAVSVLEGGLPLWQSQGLPLEIAPSDDAEARHRASLEAVADVYGGRAGAGDLKAVLRPDLVLSQKEVRGGGMNCGTALKFPAPAWPPYGVAEAYGGRVGAGYFRAVLRPDLVLSQKEVRGGMRRYQRWCALDYLCDDPFCSSHLPKQSPLA